ncbi:MAG: glycosyltransferase family protein [Hyphomicrobiaceae bacterium]
MRLLIYSHDTFGLGHLRRCRAIAHSLAESRGDLSILILSGSPIIGSFGFRSRVDYVRFPGVVKLRNGGYTSHGLDISIEDAIAMRETIIRSAALTFDPHIFLVDKEPLGLRGEVEETLRLLRSRGTRLVLGLRDILDDEEMLREEWDRKGAMAALENFYDDIWVYGRPEVCDPLAGLDAPQSVRDKMTYTGYLRRTSARVADLTEEEQIEEPYILVTTGGGGDGSALVDLVLQAYEQDPGILQNALVVLGPFMHRDAQFDFRQRAERLPRVHTLPFSSNLEHLMIGSQGVVAMGGYNTFCEILSFDKPSVIVPRTTPRLEQFIRASKMQEMGVVRMQAHDHPEGPKAMARAIRDMAEQPRPSEASPPGLLDGFSTIKSMVDGWLATPALVSETQNNPHPHLREVVTVGH